MRVLMYYSNNDVRLEEMPKPQIGPGELLMKIAASGICGSDVMEWYRRDKVPLVLGHEVAGEVVEVGDGVGNFKAGDRVAATHHVPCNTCQYCLSGHHTVCETLLKGTHFDPGGFAEYIRVPAINVDRGVFHIPEGVTYEEASFMEPLACVLRGQKSARFETGADGACIGERNIRIAPCGSCTCPWSGAGGGGRYYLLQTQKGGGNGGRSCPPRG